MLRAKAAEGAWIDVYNLHADAGYVYHQWKYAFTKTDVF
jgi:hypothetical protein